MIKQNNTLIFFLGGKGGIVTLLHILDHWEGIKEVFLSLIPRNTLKATFVNFIGESISISV